ncbi:hypothetical protein IVB08_22160 [Bradyrhizobium sp. 173]|uniref:hypothetical protein n=1 Tax=Bradyrhizobium sp. 173 TaxID=2782644 RepID=UPI001FFB5541|nr:hypothetical protein [Bradyrhizobium sp. 173]MCK1566633.1 hypothetical protein [Bradyrhizobium sp. 173]
METIAGSTALVLAMVTGLAFYFRLKMTGLQRRLVTLERVEAKLDLLLKQGGVSYEPLGGSTEIEDALKAGEKVRAVSYRAANGCPLAEAKAAIERAQRP